MRYSQWLHSLGKKLRHLQAILFTAAGLLVICFQLLSDVLLLYGRSLEGGVDGAAPEGPQKPVALMLEWKFTMSLTIMSTASTSHCSWLQRCGFPRSGARSRRLHTLQQFWYADHEKGEVMSSISSPDKGSFIAYSAAQHQPA